MDDVKATALLISMIDIINMNTVPSFVRHGKLSKLGGILVYIKLVDRADGWFDFSNIVN